MLNKEWFSARELAAAMLPSIPQTESGVLRLAKNMLWTLPEAEGSTWRKRGGRGGGLEFHYSLLQPEAVMVLARKYPIAVGSPAVSKPVPSIAMFARASDKKKSAALQKLEVLREVETLTPLVGLTQAKKQVAAAHGVCPATVYNWFGQVDGVSRHERAAALLPEYKGRTVRAPCSDEAWRFLLELYLKTNQWTFEKCFSELRKKAKQEGWVVPSAATLRRRIDSDVSQPVRDLARLGEEALRQRYPFQRRDKSAFHALECVNADGHKWDVFVRWPDGTVGRPMMVAFQDLRSDMILGWRVDRTENKELVLLVCGDIIEKYGLFKHCWLDNGRAFANKWLTGGMKNRFRFKYVENEPEGVLKSLGVEVHWTKPYSGRSKPIERSFGDMARDIARHPAFAGAWCGNSPDAKPEDFDPKNAVPLDLFLKIVHEGIEEHNDREGRRTQICAGVKSFRQAFAESYATSIITKTTEADRQAWLLAAEGVRVKKDATIELMGGKGRSPYRYHSPLLEQHAERRVVVRFDPQWMQRDLGVYALDGSFICMAPLKNDVGYADAAESKATASAYGAWKRAVKAERDALVRLTQAQVARELVPAPEPAPPPETKVVRAIFGNTVLAARPVFEEELEDGPSEVEMKFIREMARRRAERGEHLGLVPDPETDAED